MEAHIFYDTIEEHRKSTFTGWPQNMAQFFLNALTLSNINRFSKFFHCQNQEKICNNIITKDPTTPQMCRYTTLWNVSVLDTIRYDTIEEFNRNNINFWKQLKQDNFWSATGQRQTAFCVCQREHWECRRHCAQSGKTIQKHADWIVRSHVKMAFIDWLHTK